MKIKAGIESEEIYNERGLLHGALWGGEVGGGGPRALALSDVCPLKLRLSYKAPPLSREPVLYLHPQESR